MTSIKDLQDIANVLRRDVLKMTSEAGSGHPSSCLSCSEIMSVLFFNEMKYDTSDALNPDNDEFILSKGHAAPILYACLYRTGCIKNDLMKLRELNSPLEGHPITNKLKWIKVATGSLGQGESIGVGMALAAKLQKRKFRVYVLLGDSETSEGSFYEALQLASYYKLDNLCLIIDVNRLGQRGETMLGHNLKVYEERLKSFGFHVEIVDGHKINEIINAFEKVRRSRKPSVIIAKTIKGKGVSFIEDKNGWHGRALKQDELEKALNEIPDVKFPKIEIKKPEKIFTEDSKFGKVENNYYKIGEEISTRTAYGKALANLTKANSNVIALDGEVSNSTYAEEVKKVKPEQFIEAFIAEQNMVGMALGLSAKGFNVFASTFSAFLSRAHDQIRMSALSKENFTLCGSHSGVSIGEDGASQMGLEDIALFRALPSSTIFYPSDAVSTEKLVYLASKIKGVKYIRTTRPKTKVIYKNNEIFNLDDFKILRESNKDKVVLVGSGITLHEALKTYEELKKQNIYCSVVDLYCIKPFNTNKFANFVKKHGNKLVMAEDHYKEGGIGEMLCDELRNANIKIETLAIKEIPHSGKSEELLEKYQINARAIVKAAKALV